MFRRWSRLPVAVNLALTGTVLLAAYWAAVYLDYDGYCYGFADGRSPCSFAGHVRDSNGAFWAFAPFTLALAALLGAFLFAVNHLIFHALLRRAHRGEE